MAKITHFGNQRSAPAWLADWSNREHLALFPAKIDASAYSDANGIRVTVGSIAAQNATSITITALALPLNPSTVTIAAGNVLIPSGTTLSFGGAKFARLTADAILGATTLTVAALPTALAVGDVAIYSRYGGISIPSGSLVGRTYAERDANTGFGVADTLLDDEVYLTAFDIENALNNNDVELVRNGERIYENYLPNYTALAALVDEIQTLTITGTATGGTFRIGYKGAYTTALAFDATVGTVQTALRALSTLGGTTVTVTGTTGTNFIVTFGSTLAGLAIPEMFVMDIGGLTGGAPAATVVRTIGGGSAWLNKVRQLYQSSKAIN